MNQTQMKRFRERIEQKAIKAREDLAKKPNQSRLAFLQKVNTNPVNRKIDGLASQSISTWVAGKHVRASAWLTPAEQRTYEKLGEVHELAFHKIRRAEDEAIDAVVFLDEADALKALEEFDRVLARIK
jgi:hypothetical protein